MDSFPAFIPLSGARVVIIGLGEAAEAKARLFDGSPAELVRLEAEAALAPGALDGARLVFVGGVAPEMTGRLVEAARAAGALVNVVDQPALCDFITPAVVDRGSIVAGIGTGGAAPVLATLLRGEIEARWPEGLGRLGALSRKLQPAVRAALPDLPARRAFWRTLLAGPAAQAAMDGEMARAEALALAALADGAGGAGRIWVLVAPDQADRLTLAGLRALGAADHIVAGPEVAPAVMAFARRDAERSPVATPEQMAAWAEAGLNVLWLTARPDADGIEALGRAGAMVERLPGD